MPKSTSPESGTPSSVTSPKVINKSTMETIPNKGTVYKIIPQQKFCGEHLSPAEKKILRDIVKNKASHTLIFKKLKKMGIQDIKERMTLLREALKSKKGDDSDEDEDMLTEQEKEALVTVGKWGSKTTVENWTRVVDKILSVRDGKYPSDWHEQVILGALFFV